MLCAKLSASGRPGNSGTAYARVDVMFSLGLQSLEPHPPNLLKERRESGDFDGITTGVFPVAGKNLVDAARSDNVPCRPLPHRPEAHEIQEVTFVGDLLSRNAIDFVAGVVRATGEQLSLHDPTAGVSRDNLDLAIFRRPLLMQCIRPDNRHTQKNRERENPSHVCVLL